MFDDFFALCDIYVCNFLTWYLLDSGSQEAGWVQDKHSCSENKQTYKRESVTEK